VRVYELMSREVIAVRPWTPLKEVAELMLTHRISGVPVVDNDGTVVGVVSESDFLLKERGRDAVRPSPLIWLLGEQKQTRHERSVIDATTAQNAMTSPAVTIETSATVRDAATLMVDRRVNRLPVTESGHLVGIVTRSDLLRPYVRSDAQIADAVRLALHAADGIQVDSVVRGVVQVSGQAASQQMAETAVKIAEGVDGVVAVRSHRLTWPEPAVVTVVG
jgi:CBS domain-containing protein